MTALGRKESLRRAAPAHITARDTLRRHLHEARLDLKWLSGVWGCQAFSVWRTFQRTDRHLQPHHVELAITALHLDDFDANELRLLAAREAGWHIDPQYLIDIHTTRKETQ